MNDEIAAKVEDLVHDHREATIEALRELIGTRIHQSSRQYQDAIAEARLWLALRIAAKHRLVELLPDIEALIGDIRAGKAFLPYYEDMIRQRVRTAFPRI